MLENEWKLILPNKCLYNDEDNVYLESFMLALQKISNQCFINGKEFLSFENKINYGNEDIEQTARNNEVIQKGWRIKGKTRPRIGRSTKVMRGGKITRGMRKEITLQDKIFQRNWPIKYEHLTGEFFKKVLAEECRKEGLPADSFERKPSEDAIKRSPIPLKPSSTIPKTTSGMVGLRSFGPEYSLEFTGRWYISPKWTIEPPEEPGEFRVRQQRFIFLG